MKNYGKKIFIYIFCGLLTFSVVSTSYYKSAHAMEWVGGALAFEEALKWLLAAIGITATAGMTDAYWEAYGDEFTDYAIGNGATQTEVAEWQLKACQGIIDKGSTVWSKFKAWASNLTSTGGSSIVVSDIVSLIDYCSSISGANLSYAANSPISSNSPIYAAIILSDDNVNYQVRMFPTNGYYFLKGNSGSSYIYLNNSVSYGTYYWFNFSSSSSSAYISSSSGSVPALSHYLYLFNITVSDYTGSSDITNVNDVIGDTNFDSVTSNVNDLDVISSDGVDEDNPEVTIPMPGVSDSDNEASKEAYQDIIDAINDGTITQEQGLEQIQEILKIITYDTVTDEVVPPQQNDDGTDKTKDDAIKENKDNMGFTLAGLENVFPFCIPFDIYAFMTLLVAEPEAPEFDYPIQSVNGEVEEIHIDLSPFEPVAVVVRYIFDFLFIIGLGILTRSLIGGGSSD